MSLPPQSLYSDRTAFAMSDLESGKQRTSVTIGSVDSTQRPVLGRRKTTSEKIEQDKKKFVYEEDTLTKVGNALWKIHTASIVTRYALYVIPVAALLAIPLILADTVYYRKWWVQDINLLGLFIWIEIIWVALWICKLVAMAIPVVFQALSGVVSTGIRKYTTVLHALEIPLSLLLWTIAAWATSHVITNPAFQHFGLRRCTANKPAGWDAKFPDVTWKNPCDGWPSTLRKAFLAGIVVAAIFVAEKVIVQLISINYHRKQYDSKIKESKKVIWLLDLLYDASRSLFPEFCHEFEQEDEDIQGNNLAEVRNALGKAGMGTKVLNNMGRARDKATAAFGAMVSDVSGKKVFDSTSAHSIVVEALETERASKALARRLWLSFVGEGREELYKHDLVEVLGVAHEEQAEEIFSALDRDGNGDVSLDEMTMLVVSVGKDRKNRAKSMHDISQAIAVLDRLLIFIVLIAIAFVYAAFFSPDFSEKITSLWTTFTGLAFAIGGTVTEFLACCIFLFIKHPYDVGDRVDINGVELIVEHVSLMYSVFRRIDSDKTVQIPHNIANTLWIENVSRSRPMKERLTLSVAATTSMEDVLALRSELQRFVTAEENRRDFHNDLDIELISVGNLTQLDLQVEIRHKSNFANELLRSTRRNKWMCELLGAMRRIPIEPPGGSAPGLGDPANPSYSVAVSDTEAAGFRAKAAADAEASRLFPVGGGAAYIKEAMSTSVENPQQAAAAMIATVSGRRANSVKGVRNSLESMRISQESRPGAPRPPPGPYNVRLG